MKRKSMLRIAAMGLSIALAATGTNIPALASEPAGSYYEGAVGLPAPLLITEAVPNTDNEGGLDAYEYFEITNVSDREVSLEDYSLVYDNGTKKTVWEPGLSKLPANTSAVIWIKNEGNQSVTKEQFLSYYGLEADALVSEVQCDGMANSGSRSMSLLTKTGKILYTITYKAADSADGSLGVNESIAFSYDHALITAVYDGMPTPLVPSTITGVYNGQAAVGSPSVTPSSASSIREGQDLEVSVEADSTNLNIESVISGFITVDDGKRYSLTYDENFVLRGIIPYNDVKEKGFFSYKVTLFDGTNTAVSGRKNVTVLQGGDQVDQTKAPALVITEILPDSTNVSGVSADAYEFLEVYNNSDQDINLKDYKLYYHYPDSGSDSVWWETDEDKILQPGKILVFWVKNGSNDSLTKEDFNRFYQTSLPEEQLIEINCGGMANSGARGLRICTNVKDHVDFVLYNENGSDNTNKDKSITFQNQYQDGTFLSVMTSDSAAPTPGTITDTEKPYYEAKLTVPVQKPVLTDNTPSSFNNETASLVFSLDASSSETTIKTVKLYMKYEGETEYEVYKLIRENQDSFQKTLSNIDLLNKKSYSYYFMVSDGFQTITTETKTIQNTEAAGNQAFNRKENEVVSGSVSIIAYGNRLLLDEKDVSAQSVRSMNGPGKIVFEASQTDVFFKNAVAVGHDVIGVFNEGTYDSWDTYIYDIGAEHFDYDAKTITVEFHAGNKANVLEHNIENNDDFVLRNIRMVLPNGKTLYPSKYQAKMGLGAVEHDNLDDVTVKELSISSQEKEIQMGDGTSKYEILYAVFTLDETDFDALRYLWDTETVGDGSHKISNGKEDVSIKVDNTAPEITINMEAGKEYHKGTIIVSAQDAISQEVETAVLLDGKSIKTPYEFSSLDMTPGNHILLVTAQDGAGNITKKQLIFITPQESAEVTDGKVLPENGAVVKQDPTLSVTAEDPSHDKMTVTFKRGERYQLGDANITVSNGISNTAGSIVETSYEGAGNGFPYECFDILVGEKGKEDASIHIKWEGTSNNHKTFLYVYNTVSENWDKIQTEQMTDGENMILQGEVPLKEHLVSGKVKVMVQNGEGYTPEQCTSDGVSRAVTTSNTDDTPREEYDFTFAVESDTQYYNEDYDGNPDQSVNGKYQYQLDIHDWLLANRERMNIQYLFHDGDIIDDEPNEKEWQQADAAYKKLDQAGLPYGILAGNHDVGHLAGDYTNYGAYFGESRFGSNPWYGGSYQNNRAHYDLITVGGIDFIMIYTGWGIGDEEIEWLNEVLSRYPERKAILNFHEYLLASGGLGEEPQRIHDEVVAKNENVCMVLSGHYHNAYTREDTFTNADGSQRKVYSLLFDYQGLPEGGLGYMRLMHFDLTGERIIFRTYSPSLDDYDAKTSAAPNAGNSYVVAGADSSINGEENFELSFQDLGIEWKTKSLITKNLDVNVYGQEVIGTVDDVESGMPASLTWKDAPEGDNGWYAEITDENGGLTRTLVQYVTIARDHNAPVLNLPDQNTLTVGQRFDPMEGVSASDVEDGDLTGSVQVTGTVDAKKPGTYELTYEVSDSSGNKTVKKRVVAVTGTKNQSSNEGNQSEEDKKADTSVKTGDEARLEILWPLSLLSAALSLFVIRREGKKKRDR